jgi:NAD(P)-dependent dehydrogenase (short-subunit alcohol dehydrogenase family)
MTVQRSKPLLSDPRYLHSRPKFHSPDQDLPGYEWEMEPMADHGENSYQGSGRLKGLVALISGGDSGIGRAVALAYAREGADVACTYLMADEDAEQTRILIEDAGQRALMMKIDQGEGRQACEDAVNSCVEKMGKLDILVNNAAYQQSYESLEDIPEDDISRAFSTNIESFFHMTRAALRHLPAGGSIINTSSIQGFQPRAGLAPYAATKAAIANFTVAIAQSAIEQGVRVNAVAPGPVWTPLIPATLPNEKVREFGANTLFGRPAQPAELAPLYVFLASADASYITGEVYGATGGRLQI